ncbi:transcriptional regulator, GntR family [Enterococcus faecalis TX1346]|uniref:GntR family transcriptional regulator n=1 Tax=Enterococcus faecalis TaxID=1351 RepID=UPI0001F0AAA4|nr:GntR family transcriptional regulator [Enterococcus faecalis]EFU17565.1 transcriptional regulator, GntR family [Enterococcus faecalis TX1346]
MQPKYEIIKQDIIKKITTGEFKAGEKIYSEGELKKKYNVSSTTVVRALQDLVLEGYLIRRQGEGTYVRRNLRHKKVYFDENGPLIDMKLKEHRENITENTMTFIHQNVYQPEINQQLELDKDEPLAQIVQLAMIDSSLWKIQVRYVANQLLTDETIKQLKSGKSLSEEYKKQNNLNTLPMKQEIRFGLLANELEILHRIPEEIKTIDWSLNLPIVKVSKKYLNHDKKPIEFSTTLIHYQHYSISIEYEGV